MTKAANIMIVGFGPYAQQALYPIFERYGKKWGASVVCIVELKEKRRDVEAYFASRPGQPPETHYADPSPVGSKTLGAVDETKLGELAKKRNVDGIIIATEPSSHMVYARWAMKNGLNAVIAKPLSARRNAATNLVESRGLLDDYDELLDLYEKAKLKKPDIVVSVMTQMRYHNSFRKIKELLGEVFVRTGCPVTALQIYHADGQWRMPDELIDINYHGFNQGYGVISHSGYHVFDIVPFLLEATRKLGAEIDNVDAVSMFTRSADLTTQMTYEDYANLFPDFSPRYLEKLYAEETKGFGEVDAHTSLSFKHGDSVMTQATISLLHNSFSQRAWLSSEGRDLAKGNGRIIHETYQISQGPFQTIYCESYKGRKSALGESDLFSLGGKSHIDIHVYRNNKMLPEWEQYRKYSAGEMHLDFPEGDINLSVYEGARRKCIKEFIGYIQGAIPRKDLVSELPSHYGAVILTSAAYQSAVLRLNNENPLVNLVYGQRSTIAVE